MKKLAIVVVLAAAACGHKNKNDVNEGGGGGTVDPNASSGDSTDRSGDQIDPQKMDEVRQLLDRKQMVASRCLSMAIEAGNAPKGTHGKITYEIKISSGGQATSVEVVKTSIESKDVQGCVKKHIEEIEFPQMRHDYETSYTFAMEAN